MICEWRVALAPLSLKKNERLPSADTLVMLPSYPSQCNFLSFIHSQFSTVLHQTQSSGLFSSMYPSYHDGNFNYLTSKGPIDPIYKFSITWS